MALQVAPVWGLVGGLSFLVLSLAVEIAGALSIPWPTKVIVALLVTAVVAVLVPPVARRAAGWNGQV